MNLNGWSAVHTLTFSQLNGRLAASAAQLATVLNQSGVVPGGGTWQLQGTLAPWVAAPGTAPDAVRLTLRFASGSFTSVGASQNLAGLGFVVETPLVFAAAGPGMELRFAFAGPGGNPGALQLVSAIPPVSPELTLAFLEALRAAAGGVSFAIATLQAAPWLGPGAIQAVAIGQPPGAAEPMLAVCRAAGAAPGAPLVPVGVFAPNQPVGLALAPEIWLGNFVAQALPQAVGAAGAVNFIGAGPGAIQASSSFPAPTLPVGGYASAPVLRQFMVNATGPQLATEVQGVCNLKLPGSTMNFSVQLTSAVSWAGGGLTFSAGTPSLSSSPNIPWYAFLVAPTFAVAVTRADLQNQTAPALANDLGPGLSGALAGMNFVHQVVTAVHWAGASLSPQAAGLDGGVLVLQGVAT